jgi:hypothetical protein
MDARLQVDSCHARPGLFSFVACCAGERRTTVLASSSERAKSNSSHSAS